MRPEPRTSLARSNGGFTLVELMTVLAVLAILAAVAIPDFRSLTESQRVRSASFEMFAAMNWVRSEAIKRNTTLTMSAVDGDWSQGWEVRTDALVVVGDHNPLAGVVITPDPASITSVQFLRTGRIGGAPPRFQIDVSATPTGNVRCLFLDLGGRPRSAKGVCP